MTERDLIDGHLLQTDELMLHHDHSHHLQNPAAQKKHSLLADMEIDAKSKIYAGTFKLRKIDFILVFMKCML